MKARIKDSPTKVYSSMDENAISIATLPVGAEVELGGTKRKAGKLWVPVTLSTGQQAFIPGETHVDLIRLGALWQNDVEVHTEPSAESMVKQKLARNSKVYILQVVKSGLGTEWVKVRDMNGIEGYIAGNTRLRVVQQNTKALGMKNLRTGVMWLIAGLIILFSGPRATGGVYNYFGYGAVVFGGTMLITGLIQYIKAPS
jgi:uncharacterized protein YgiM (DUF1202 family)